MSDFVLDSSAALAWCFADEFDSAAEALLELVAESVVLVPQHWPLELANALWAGQRSGRLSADTRRDFTNLLDEARIDVDPDTGGRAYQETLHLALHRNLAVYDAAYVELAKRSGLPVASRDEAMIRAAVAEQVPVIRG